MADKELESAEAEVSLESDDQIADEIVESEADQVADDSPDEPEVISSEDFSKWQSKYDKRLQALEKENEELKAKVVQPSDGPSPEEQRRYNDLRSQYDQLRQQAEKDDSDPSIFYQLGALQNSLIDAEATVIARTVGIDPSDPEFRDMIRTDEVQSGKDIERIAWKIKATSQPDHQKTTSLTEREKKLEQAEKDFEKRLQAEVRKATAQLRQELGLNATPSAQPSVAGGKLEQLQRQLKEAKAAGNWQMALRTKSEIEALR